MIYPAGPADGCNRSLFKFASEPGKQPGAQRAAARKPFSDSEWLTTHLPPLLSLLPPLTPPPHHPQPNTHTHTHTLADFLSLLSSYPFLIPFFAPICSTHMLHCLKHARVYAHSGSCALLSSPGSIPGIDAISRRWGLKNGRGVHSCGILLSTSVWPQLLSQAGKAPSQHKQAQGSTLHTQSW